MPTIKVHEKLVRECEIEVTHTELAMLLVRNEVNDGAFVSECEYARDRVTRLAVAALADTEVSSEGVRLSKDGRYL